MYSTVQQIEALAKKKQADNKEDTENDDKHDSKDIEDKKVEKRKES